MIKIIYIKFKIMCRFIQICSLLEKESSKLKKIEIISDEIKHINNEKDLYLFCLYLSGQIYPPISNKNLSIGPAIIKKSLQKLLNLSDEDWDKEYAKTREIGITTENLMKKFTKRDLIGLKINVEQTNCLTSFEILFDNLSSNTRSLVKINILSDFLDQIDPLVAKYLVRLLDGNLRIGVLESTVEEAISKAFQINKKQIQKANFFIGDIGEVAIKAFRNELDKVEFRLFHPIKVMLATAENNIDKILERMGEEIWAEYKYDGIRAHIHKENNKVEIYSRDQNLISYQFPELIDKFMKIPISRFLLDGEIVPYNGQNILPFAYIQKRLGKKKSILEESKINPTTFVAYDILIINNKILFDTPFHYRRKILEENFENTDILISKSKKLKTKEEVINFLKEARIEGREGLLIKNYNSIYESGKRGINWIKLKETLETLDVAIIEAYYGEGKKSKYLSIFTVGVWNNSKTKIIPIGRVASGADENELKNLLIKLEDLKVQEIKNGYIIKPEIVLEIEYENIQISNRYNSGYALRFPRIKRFRNDKNINEINSIEDVKKIYNQIKGLTTK